MRGSDGPGVAAVVKARVMGAPRRFAALSMVALCFVAGAGADTSEEIRSWGCNLHFAPFVFHHIGKAAGGGIRARFSASAQNYSTDRSWKGQEWSHYLVEDENGVTHHGHFCSSSYPHFWPTQGKAFEGVSVCKATTPLGQMLGCPLQNWRCACKDGDRCDKVYAGHNPLGTELHWITPEYLMQHWYPTQPPDARIAGLLEEQLAKDDFILGTKKERIHMQDVVCPEKEGIPHDMRLNDDVYERCFSSSVARIDQIAEEWWPNPKDWSLFMASLPVARVTVLREPAGWLLSQFFWHGYYNDAACDDISVAAAGAGRTDWSMHDLMTSRAHEPKGWMVRIAMKRILYLCGEHRLVQMQHGLVDDLADIEREAAGNLRNSFAVVGILHNGLDEFYDMVNQRIAYMDTTLNPDVQGLSHSTGSGEEKARCKARYKDPAFLQELMEASPEFGMLMRLYETAVKVNKFQKEELASCVAP
uniref:Sulfotransferase domain-containing protein n=1 Tax=Phaeomonas parva TaxID=124430 RepID=A0A7S1UFW2_9STRA|mmetsp:Transcript_46306/g.144855  ORF Transcript_46306/g.144855 Transcript_46306/m.144855 type:complete len:474 (+) Transcript_46306:218-1639(+)